VKIGPRGIQRPPAEQRTEQLSPQRSNIARSKEHATTGQLTPRGSTQLESPALGGGLPPPLLEHRLAQVAAALDALEASAAPDTAAALVDFYRPLGLAVSTCEACLLEAVDALDARTGGGAADPATPFENIRALAFDGLRRAGALFARVEADFASIVHGDKSWPNQPFVVQDDRGDGRPLYNYRDTFKLAPGLSEDQRQAEFQQRRERFIDKGGRFEDMIEAQPGLFDTLEDGRHYDYTMLPGGAARLIPLSMPDEPKRPKCGHSLLAVGGPDFREQPVLCAGELWVINDAAGDVEAVVVANNSGHFKPAFEDLENTLPYLEALGVPRDKIVLFGGPNKLSSIYREIGERYPDQDLTDALPPTAAALRAAMAQTYDPISVRARS